MPIDRGAWWNTGGRPIMKVDGRAAITADVETSDIAASAVTGPKVADGVITSEKATANLRANSITLYFAGATSTEAAGQVRPCSTGNAVWRPSINVSVLGITRYSLALEEMATCDNFVLYGNNGTCIGGILLKAGTTNPVGYTRTCSGALTQTALAAGTNVLVQRLSSTCSVQGASLIQIDWESTG